MEEIPLTSSSDSFEDIISEEHSGYDIINTRDSSLDFVEVNFKDLTSKQNQKNKTANKNELSRQDFNDLAILLENNETTVNKQETKTCELKKKTQKHEKSKSNTPFHLANPNHPETGLPPEIKLYKNNEGTINNEDLFNVKVKPETEHLVSSMLTLNKPINLIPLKPKTEPKVEVIDEGNIKVLSPIIKLSPKIEVIESTQEPSMKDEQGTKKRKSKYELLQEKKQKRLIRNRASAKVHREKQKYQKELLQKDLTVANRIISELRQTINELIEENCLIKSSLTKTEAENRFLRSELDSKTEKVVKNAVLNLDELDALYERKIIDIEDPLCNANNIEESSESDNHSLFSWFMGSKHSECSESESGSRKRVRAAARKANQTIKKKLKTVSNSKSATIALFGITAFLSFMNFGYTPSESVYITEEPLPLIEMPKYFSTDVNESVAMALNRSKHREVALFGEPELKDISVHFQPKNVELITQPVPLNMDYPKKYFIPITTGKMMDLAMELNPNVGNSGDIVISSGKALVPQHGYGYEPSSEEESYYKTQLWKEFSRLNEVLKSRPSYFEGSDLRYPHPKAQSVTLYNDPSTKQLIAIQAVQNALSTYLSFVKGTKTKGFGEAFTQGFESKALNGKNFILCPTAYGALTNLESNSFDSYRSNSIQVNTTDVTISRLRKHKSLRSSLDEENDNLEVGETANGNSVMNSLLTLVVPSSSVSETEGSSKDTLLELTCRIEQVNELLVPRQ